MVRGVRLYLVGSFVLVSLAGCGRGFFQSAEREPWRTEAEIACLKSGAVKENADRVRINPISGPGICGAEYPLKVAALGDWQTEGKGSVRIERCGRALCGHVRNPSSSDNGEMVLINMKPKTAALWSGIIYSHDSENTYYATIAMKGPDSLWVKACALGRFYCSGNLWSRIGGKPEKLVISRQTSPKPRS